MLNQQNSLNKNKQSGVVLFIALIALVVMSLAAAALIRSVDTNTLITGNLAFKQSAIVSSDRGVETAVGWLNAQAIADVASLNVDSVGNGYFSTFDALDLDDRTVLRAAATWANNSAVASGVNITAGRETDTGNEIRYIVQRMCREPNVAPNVDDCQFGAGNDSTGSIGGDHDLMLDLSPLPSPMYRITVRVAGPKNTVSYTQTYTY
ncbi:MULTISPECIES: pilus assembly PilX family protein [Methylotenera]|uniref:pilus assembly PilX family protein n=1 Tax=Methylotenera TaxID=359407 RepID=UPI000365E398|nr:MULTISPECIES: hypothetical protein [Methylotenera]